MLAVQKSAEHHYLTTIQSLKGHSKNWAVLYFGFSRNLHKKNMGRDVKGIHENLNSMKQKAKIFYNDLQTYVADIPKGFLYLFQDCDVLVLCPYGTDDDKMKVQNLYKFLEKKVNSAHIDFSLMEHELYTFQKLADRKLLSAQQIEAYNVMADQYKTASIPIRRKKRDHPVVQVIEDDRFTLSYASSILNKEYDVVLSRTGEQGIVHYIENAPDIVFIDIHLPGISGHQVLNNIKIVDKDVFAVMLSVDTMKDNIVQAAQTGANNFLKKPFSKERLLNIVRSSPYVQDIALRNSSSASN